MKYDKIELENGIKKEWIITNGIGGYASSTVLGINTRRYHGLLIAPLEQPARRHLILSKVDESIQIGDKKYNLYSNMCKNYISKGFEYQVSFEKEYVPIFTYKIDDVIVKKYICMEHGKNTVILLYRVFNNNKNMKLTLAPVMNFRDFHSESYNHQFEIEQKKLSRKVKVIIDKQDRFPIYMNCSDGFYMRHQNDTFNNMFYLEEEKRGLQSEENHIVPGRYEINIREDEAVKDITFVASLEENIEEIDGKIYISKEIARIGEIVYDSGLLTSNLSAQNEIGNKKELKKIELIRNYVIAADNFVVYRPTFGLHTIIAGYPWFLDWGRDTLIAFEGLLLKTKRYNIAKEVLLTMIRNVKYGLVPNGYSEYDNSPLYNSVDSSLLLFEQIKKYINYTGDFEFIKENFYEVLEKIIEAYKNGIDVSNNNIYLDEDYLISSGTEYTQNTWMDAKIGAYSVTPRNGKAVEINSMWYNALRIMQELATKFKNKKEAIEYKKLADECQESFVEKFYNKKRKCLYDVIGESKIRPNQLFALSLSYPVLEPSSKEAIEMFDTVTKKLLNNYGLKTLAKGEENYIEVYEGDNFRRDMSYHQGITWPWLLGIYYDSFKKLVKSQKGKEIKKRLEEDYTKFVNNVKATFTDEFLNGKTICGISELYDSKKPYESKGAFTQAWSVAEVFRIILEK